MNREGSKRHWKLYPLRIAGYVLLFVVMVVRRDTAVAYCSASYIENIYHSAIDHSLTFLRMSQKSKVAK